MEHDLLIRTKKMFELLKNFLNWRSDRDSNVAVAEEPTPTPVSRQTTRLQTVSRSQAPARTAAPPAVATPTIALTNPALRTSSPAVPAPVAANGDTISLPLRNIIAQLPEEFTGFVNCPPDTQLEVALARDKILRQLPKGVVRLPFGDIRRAAPTGTFVNFDKLDNQPVVIPLEDIVPRLGAAFLPRRTDQKKVTIPDNISAPFNPTGAASYSDTHTAARELTVPKPAAPAPQPARAAAPAATLAASPTTETRQRVQPVQDPEIPENIFFSRKNAPPAATTRPTSALPAEPAAPAPAIPAEPPATEPLAATTLETNASDSAAVPPVAYHSSISYNTITEPVTFSNEGAPVEAAPGAIPPIPAPAPFAATPVPPITATPIVPVFETPAQPQPVPIEARETTFFRRGCLRMPISVLTEKWPAAILDEVAQQNLSRAQLEIPANEVEPGLRTGKLVFSWRQIRTWLSGVAKSDDDSPNDATPVELPLRIVAPLFLSQRSLDNSPKKVSVPESIPNLFGPGSTGFKTGFVKKIEEAVERQQDTVPTVAVAPAPPAAPPAPAPIAATVETDTSVIRRIPHAIHEVFGEAEKSNWTPIEIVRRTAKLRGVHGALICTQDGLLVAENYTSIAGNETFCALITQMFNRISNQSKELVLGLPTQMSFVADNTTYQAFRTGRVIYIVVSNAGERLPQPELLVVAEYLSKTSR